MARPTGTQKMQAAFHIPPEQHRKLKKLGVDLNMSMSQLIETAISELLKKQGGGGTNETAKRKT
jgi:methylmalonyl-CoA mutase cobalamin-binding subunit